MRNCPDEDLLRNRTLDEGFDAELLQPSTLAAALPAAMEKARVASREFRAQSDAAAAMEIRAIEAMAKGSRIADPENWIKAEVAKRLEDFHAEACSQSA
jgi:hypothetical protein